MTISEKVAYLKGMLEGMELEKSKEAKLIASVLDVLEDIAGALDTFDDRFEAAEEEIDALSDDLADVEEYVYDGEEDEEDGCCCEDEDDFFEIECPNCGEPLEIDDEVLEEGMIQCPSCEQKFVLDLSDEEDECGCGCCHGHDHEDEDEDEED